MPVERTHVPKSVRFEVFKRDKFKCQYCGKCAPDVILHLDHIHPVAEGGRGDILNLITSCVDCNLGKGAKLLSDHSAVQKQRDQLADLQERKEQLEMMLQWRESLQEYADDTIEQLHAYWNKLAPGWHIGESGLLDVRRWLREYSAENIMKGMDISAANYLKRDEAGKITGESWETAFSKISGICRTTELSKDNPNLKRIMYIRGIVRNRLKSYYNNGECLSILREAVSWGVQIDLIDRIACRCSSWSGFKGDIQAAIEKTPAWIEEHALDD